MDCNWTGVGAGYHGHCPKLGWSPTLPLEFILKGTFLCPLSSNDFRFLFPPFPLFPSVSPVWLYHPHRNLQLPSLLCQAAEGGAVSLVLF